jgi:hypothetical protein
VKIPKLQSIYSLFEDWKSMHTFISHLMSRKDFSAAIWRPEMSSAEIVKIRKGTASSNGIHPSLQFLL